MRFVILFAALWIFADITNAAEITIRPKNKSGQYIGVFAIEGKIEKGDYDKLKDAIKNTLYIYNEVIIASRGGDVLEAMKIGRLIRKLKFSTSGPFDWHSGNIKIFSFDVKDKSNDVCASSCFFIYVAGVNRSGNLVGIHRPYLLPEDYKKMGVDDAMYIHKKLKSMVAEYFEEMSVPAYYTDRLFSVPKEEVEWLKAKELQKDFWGFIPEMDEWIKAQCPSLTEIEKATKKNPLR